MYDTAAEIRYVGACHCLARQVSFGLVILALVQEAVGHEVKPRSSIKASFGLSVLF